MWVGSTLPRLVRAGFAASCRVRGLGCSIGCSTRMPFKLDLTAENANA